MPFLPQYPILIECKIDPHKGLTQCTLTEMNVSEERDRLYFLDEPFFFTLHGFNFYFFTTNNEIPLRK